MNDFRLYWNASVATKGAKKQNSYIFSGRVGMFELNATFVLV